MFIKTIITLIVSLLSAYFYHCGGLGKTTQVEKNEDKWVPLFLRMSWVRDWVCPLFSLIILFTWWKPNIWQGYLLSIPVYGLMGIAFSTYWDDSKNKFIDRINKVINWKYPQDNFYLHGLFIGLSFFPFYFVGMKLWTILASSIISAILMGWLCDRTNKSWLEECGRGFISAITRVINKF